MGKLHNYLGIAFFCSIISSALPQVSAAQDLLVQPYRLTLLAHKGHDQTTIRLAHDFPGFVQMRLVYAYANGKFIHRISTILQGYHKIWSLRPIPLSAEKLQFQSLSVQYGIYTLQCDQAAARCILQGNGHVLDSSFVFNPQPLMQPAKESTVASK